MKTIVTGSNTELIRAYLDVYQPSVRTEVPAPRQFIALWLAPTATVRSEPEHAAAVRAAGTIVPSDGGFDRLGRAATPYAPQATLCVGMLTFVQVSTHVIALRWAPPSPDNADGVVYAHEVRGPDELLRLAADECTTPTRTGWPTHSPAAPRAADVGAVLIESLLRDNQLVRAFARSRDLRALHLEECAGCRAASQRVDALTKGFSC